MLAENPHKRYVSNVITPDQFSVNEVFIWPNKRKLTAMLYTKTILIPKNENKQLISEQKGMGLYG